MKLVDHYEKLFSSIPEAETDKAYRISINDIAMALRCTTRNAKIILKKMKARKWIDWVPGRGRGCVSKLLFLVPVHMAIIEEVKQLATNDQFNRAFALLKSHGLAEDQNEPLLQWLSATFGYRTITEGQIRTDTLRLPSYRPLPMLDPCHVTRRTEMHMVRQLFETLVGYDRETNNFIPGIAHDWEVNHDRTVWRFYLRKGIPFHHGRLLDAEDVKFTVNRLRSENIASPYRWMFENVKKISVLDPCVIEFVMNSPDYLFLHAASSTAASIVPRDLCSDGYEEFNRLPSGTGPFKLIQNDQTRLILKVFTEYYACRPHLDTIEMWVLPGIYEKELTEIDLGQYGTALHPYRYGSIQTDQWRSKKWIDRGCKFLTVNIAKQGHMKNPALRKALNQVIDRKKMIAELGDNRSIRAYGFLSEQCGNRAEESPIKRGQPDFGGVTIHLYTYWGAGNEKDAEWIKQAAESIGVNIIVSILPYTQLKQKKNVERADLILTEQAIDQQEVMSWLAAYQNKGSFLTSHLSPDFRRMADDLLWQTKGQSDYKQRILGIRRLESKLIEDDALLFLYRWQQQQYFHPDLQGIKFNSLGWVDYKDLWFKSH